MKHQEVINLVNHLINQHRVQIGKRPPTTPIKWKGISMTVEEAKLVIRELEAQKLGWQKTMNNTQTGGEITKLAANGVGLAAMVTGAALLLFPPTSIAGAITLASGFGASKIGETLGEGINDVGSNHCSQEIHQLESYIDSIKNTLIAMM